MKKILIGMAALITVIAFACNTPEEKATATADSTSVDTTIVVVDSTMEDTTVVE